MPGPHFCVDLSADTWPRQSVSRMLEKQISHLLFCCNTMPAMLSSARAFGRLKNDLKPAADNDSVSVVRASGVGDVLHIRLQYEPAGNICLVKQFNSGFRALVKSGRVAEKHRKGAQAKRIVIAGRDSALPGKAGSEKIIDFKAGARRPSVLGVDADTLFGLARTQRPPATEAAG